MNSTIFDFRGHWRQLTQRPTFHEPVVDGIRAMAVLWVLILHMAFFHYGTFAKETQAIFTVTGSVNSNAYYRI